MNTLLQHSLMSQAERRPDATALVMGQERLTYSELEGSSNQLARLLRESGCQKGDRVCLLMPKSPTAIVSILGILKADCSYVPLDISSPSSRLVQMVTSSEPRCILATDPVAPLLDEILEKGNSGRTILIGWMNPEKGAGEYFTAAFSRTDLLNYKGQPLDYQNTWNDAAYILFTSGSTGTPKGVLITHANVIHFIRWAIKYFGISSSDRISGHPPFHFDLSVFDMFGAFAAGAELHLVPPGLLVVPNKLVDFIRASELTQWFSVPSALNYMAKFDVVQFNDFPALRRLLWCGEVLPTTALIYFMRRLPHVTFTNLYGPTEATIASSYYTVQQCPEDDRASIPIGAACEGEELLVLNGHLQPVQPGEVGDLYIRGVGLSPGYWRDEEKTRCAFLRNPNGADASDRIYKTGDLARIGEDGLIYFLGRADSQIKSWGYRIELGEIEAALNALNWIQEGAVVAIPTNGFETLTICCAYVPVRGADTMPIRLRDDLGKALPPYMLPSRWMVFDRLPKNANGKIDRTELKSVFAVGATATQLTP